MTENPFIHDDSLRGFAHVLHGLHFLGNFFAMFFQESCCPKIPQDLLRVEPTGLFSKSLGITYRFYTTTTALPNISTLKNLLQPTNIFFAPMKLTCTYQCDNKSKKSDGSTPTCCVARTFPSKTGLTIGRQLCIIV